MTCTYCEWPAQIANDWHNVTTARHNVPHWPNIYFKRWIFIYLWGMKGKHGHNKRNSWKRGEPNRDFQMSIVEVKKGKFTDYLIIELRNSFDNLSLILILKTAIPRWSWGRTLAYFKLFCFYLWSPIHPELQNFLNYDTLITRLIHIPFHPNGIQLFINIKKNNEQCLRNSRNGLIRIPIS